MSDTQSSETLTVSSRYALRVQPEGHGPPPRTDISVHNEAPATMHWTACAMMEVADSEASTNVTSFDQWADRMNAAAGSTILAIASFVRTALAMIHRRSHGGHAKRLRCPWPETPRLPTAIWDCVVPKDELPRGIVWSHPQLPQLIDMAHHPRPNSAVNGRASAWIRVFGNHPHRDVLCTGAAFGFPLMCNIPAEVRIHENPQYDDADNRQINDWIASEVAAGNMIDITTKARALLNHTRRNGGALTRRKIVGTLIVSPISLARKPDSDSVRVCHNLSAPHHNGSVNEHTSYSDMEPMQLASVHMFSQRLRFLRRMYPSDADVVLSRVDLRSCFRQFALRPADMWKLAMRHQGQVFAHTVVIWGSRSAAHTAALITNAIADIVRYAGHNISVFLDDFILIGLRADVERAIAALRAVLNELKLAENVEKFVPPSSCGTVLGVHFNLDEGRATVTDKRRLSLIETLTDILSRGDELMSERELQSLTGKLSFIGPVITWSRPRLFVLWRLLANHKPVNGAVVIHSEARHSLTWFLSRLSREDISIDLLDGQRLHKRIPLITGVATDASDSGYGGLCCATRTFIRGTWRAHEVERSINYRELYTVVMAAAAFGPALTGHLVKIDCDNISAVCATSQGGANNHSLRLLVSVLCALQEHFRFLVFVTHLAGALNHIPDALSRGRFPVEWERHNEMSPPGEQWIQTAVPSSIRSLSTSELQRFCDLNPVQRSEGRFQLDWQSGMRSVMQDTSTEPTSSLGFPLTVCPWTIQNL